MATTNKNVRKNTYKRPTEETPEKKFTLPKFNPKFSLAFLDDKRFRMSIGLLLVFSSIITLFSLLSFIFTGKADQSVIESVGLQNLLSSGLEVENWIGLVGAAIAHFLVYHTFGIGSIAIIPVLFVGGLKLLTKHEIFPTQKLLWLGVFLMIWTSILFGYYVVIKESPNMLGFLSGSIGYLLAEGLYSLTGWGTILILLASMGIFIIYNFRTSTLEGLAVKWFGKYFGKEPETTDADKHEMPKDLDEEMSKADEEADDESDLDEEDEPEAAKERYYPATAEQLKEYEKQATAQQGSNIVIHSAGQVIVHGDENRTQIRQDKQAQQEVRQPEKQEFSINVNFPDKENQAPEKQVIKEITKVEQTKQQYPVKAAPAPVPQKETFEIEDTEEGHTLSVTDTSEVDKADVESIKDLVGEQLTIEDMDHYDPKLDLGRYQYPDLDLLNEAPTDKIKVTEEELAKNKEKIVETLNDFKINIKSISATIGPTVTLYEIVPESGIKISRIRSLEDDIALSLAALGIRIIAPIPGKGTIGIEVPNENSELVSMRSVLATKKFVNTDKALPVAFGRTISNEVFVADLAKMPHLLMAGATGQGKSVGINVILTSLLYKKHPSELKFVMIDPKKVELSLFNIIERHYLASLPDAEEAIITDTKKAVYVLNSLCIEMDSRYDLLKKAGTRNIAEYNKKFQNRKLNPNKGHRFLPYIVLVIDELADLMMTAGKEIETPIARLAQLARAIGIHLVVATQRPSVDVITGMIKANFPARLSFRVSSKIDSRTILDAGGAEQLIGRGDMLLSNGNEMIRLQCAFVDTEEVERLCEYISNQQGYDTAYMLPEFEGENESSAGGVNLADRDELFEEAARLLVRHQQGSTSLIQRKLSLGYNRAGRIIDQLEAAGVVGPFEGSKARQVLVNDEVSLEMLLSSL
ncbi:DNA translocase FtsK [Limibacter armeniacum]|uniref:DNA translocase FtsK n=1 Tax=Limibacter armeniacum TaxID=466084 RepID=UPI002FE59DE9